MEADFLVAGSLHQPVAQRLQIVFVARLAAAQTVLQENAQSDRQAKCLDQPGPLRGAQTDEMISLAARIEAFKQIGGRAGGIAGSCSGRDSEPP